MSASGIDVARLIAASALPGLALALVENGAIVRVVASGDSCRLGEMRRSGLINGGPIEREMAKSGRVR
jgi:hypothetical protein